MPFVIGAVVAGVVLARIAQAWVQRRTYRRAQDAPRRAGQARWLLVAMPAVAGAWAAVLPPTMPLWPIATAVALTWVVGAEIDLDVHRLPDTLTLTSFAGFALALAAALLLDVVPVHTVATASLAAAILAGCAFLAGLATGQVGLGDVKLLAGVGLVIGSISRGGVVCAVLAMSLAGAVAAAAALARGRGRSTNLAAGPGIVLGAVAGPVAARLLGIG